MASVSQMFVNMINEGINTAKTITSAKDKALVYAELAKALAMTGLVGESSSANATPEEVKEALQEKPKTKQKTKAKEEAVKEEVVKEETIASEEKTEKEKTMKEAAAESDDEIVDEWTEEMIEKFSEQLEAVQQLQEEYDEDTINECVQAFSEGVLNSIEDITPLNIDGFLAYMKMLIEDAEEAE